MYKFNKEKLREKTKIFSSSLYKDLLQSLYVYWDLGNPVSKYLVIY